MKKLIALIFLSLMFTGVKFYHSGDFDTLKGYDKVVIVCEKLKAEKIENIGFDQQIESGNDIYFIFKNKSFNDLKAKFKNDFKGVNLYFNNSFSLKDFENMLNLTFSENYKIDSYQVYSSFYEGFLDFKIVNGKKINVQLVKTQQNWVLGFPLIITGF